ncbi:MAG TPA: F0F1 ATP synthase subunit B [Longimicrobiales bacterium]
MNLNLIAIASEAGAEPSIFGINAGVSFWTLIIFLLLSVVLAKFAFPPILGYAAAREQRIQDALDEARRQREESEQLLAQQRQELLEARQQAQALIAEGKQAAERVREDMLARARTEQEELVARARQDIERDRQKAIESLRREAVDLALAAAGRLVGQRMDAAEDRRLVADYLRSVDSVTGAGAA